MAPGALGWVAVASTASDPLTLAGFALAGVAGVTILAGAAAGVVRLARRRRAEPRGTVTAPLDRLDYLPSVTSRALRLRWAGSRYWSLAPAARLPVDSRERSLIGVRRALAAAMAEPSPPDTPSGQHGVDRAPAVPGSG